MTRDQIQMDTLIKYLSVIKSPLGIILVGVPGSGKTTLARAISPYIEPVIICSTDSFDPRLKLAAKSSRGMMVLLDHYIVRATMTGASVIVDQTSMERVNREQRLLQFPESYLTMCIDMSSVELEKCIAHVKERFKQGGRNVPEDVIRALHAKYEAPIHAEGFDFVYDLVT
jgi:tRNA uridine 5-carbamoylmethylation protein Kti12